jgi:hypothetical protein
MIPEDSKIMNLGQYRRCSHVAGVPMGYQYDGSQILSSQPTEHTHTFDGISCLPLENEFLNIWPSTTRCSNHAIPMLSGQASTEWVIHGCASSNFEESNLVNDCGYYYRPSASFQRCPQTDGSPLSSSADGLARSWQLAHDESMLGENTTSAPNIFDITPYVRKRSTDETSNFPTLEPSVLYEGHDRSRDFIQLHEIRSLKAGNDGLCHANSEIDNVDLLRVHLSDTSDDSGTSSREMTAMELDDLGIDEPYAKLIYRALMSAPNHAMVLQEIYQWFRDNTAKGSSDSKGWMNSIRHNLSMNAVRWPCQFLHPCLPSIGL